MALTAKIDSSDRKILAELQSNARQSNKRLAAAVGLAQSTTLERVRELERRAVITGYSADVDLRALGRELQAMVTLRVQPKTSESVDKVLAVVEALPETVSVYLLSGIDDVLVHLAVNDADHLRSVVMSQIANLDNVVDEHTSLVFEHRRRRVLRES